jgi:hypothetical protein
MKQFLISIAVLLTLGACSKSNTLSSSSKLEEHTSTEATVKQVEPQIYASESEAPAIAESPEQHQVITETPSAPVVKETKKPFIERQIEKKVNKFLEKKNENVENQGTNSMSQRMKLGIALILIGILVSIVLGLVLAEIGWLLGTILIIIGLVLVIMELLEL